MKKRNWLLSLVFAVLSLTIISTCVIGSTYAKFTSQITGSSSAQAAGFLITAGTVGDISADELLMAPSEGATVTMPLKYFSQVETKLSAGESDGMTGTGVFLTANWDKLILAFNNDINNTALGELYGIAAANSSTVTTGLAVTDVIKVNIADGSGDFAAQLAAAIAAEANTAGITALKVDDAATGAYENVTLTPMAANQSAVVSLSIELNVAWESLKVASTSETNDLFDTFIGQCIACLATGENFVLDIGTDLVGIVGHGTVEGVGSWLIDNTEKAVSTVGISLNVKAEQVTTEEMTWVTP